ncbi:flagellar hook-length control protein FliK [Thiohalobacter thiocyanaticus]|uniref:Flagellar hook-length control protein FliK n=1 Tax=Thiohalobacter thiocyanaticus TaxID=585455 RepID=A0A426QGN7_9GAMM|nr:flagellar hook-length control protein FliK [Thiohalobacter thiocyanaticus]RRQ20919.1 flagellar hook-length control protein FliK [Thiohalobacter thiocyanaticus]
MAELPVSPVKVQPVPAKASGQGPARQSESADSDSKSPSFSSELNKRMDSDKAGGESRTAEARQGRAANGGQPGEAGTGKTLPAEGGADQARAEAAEAQQAREEAGLAALLNTDGADGDADSLEQTEVSPLALAQMLLDAAPGRSGEAAASGQALKADTARQLPDTARMLTQGGSQPPLAQAVQDSLQDGELSADLFRQFMARGGEQRAETAAAQLAQLAARNPDAAGLQRLASTEAMFSHATPGQGMAQTAQPNPAGSQPALPTTQIPLPMQHPQWGDALSEKVMWMTNQKLQGAEIKLNPPQLGPIEVRVSLNNDSGQSQAQVNFTAQHALTRDALESALPRLREMFNANGVDLVDVNVSDRSFAEQDRDTAQAQQQQFMAGLGETVDGEEGLQGVSAKITQLPDGMLDLFA